MKNWTKHITILSLLLQTSLFAQSFNLMSVRPSDKVAISSQYIITSSGIEQYTNTNITQPFAISSSDTLFVGMSVNTTSVGGQQFMPNQSALAQNYPNPFNNSTVIRYTINELSFVTITVYDITGKEIATMVNEQKNSGTYSVGFNNQNVASGTYVYRMVTNSSTGSTTVDTKKMIVMK